MPTSRSGCSSAAVKGRVYVLGGKCDADPKFWDPKGRAAGDLEVSKNAGTPESMEPEDVSSW